MNWLLVVILALLVVGLLYESIAGRRELRHFSPPGRIIEIKGVSFHCQVLGERKPGQPLVVLEPGLMFWSRFFDPVSQDLNSSARVFAYDRAGYGWSQPSKSRRTPAFIAGELHALLASAGEKPPYLLIGHSMGGVFVREFYRHYPQEVKGMVLLDSAHEKQFEFLPHARAETHSLLAMFATLAVLARLGVIRAFLKPVLLRNFSSVKGQADEKVFAALASSPSFFITGWRETRAFLDQKDFPEDTPDLGDLPLAVIRARYPEQPHGRMSPQKYRELVAGWARIQEDLASRSTRGRLITASAPGHNLMQVEPDLIIKTIREMLQKT